MIQAITLTASGRIGDHATALSAGFNTFAAKPVEPYKLILAISNLAGRSTSTLLPGFLQGPSRLSPNNCEKLACARRRLQPARAEDSRASRISNGYYQFDRAEQSLISLSTLPITYSKLLNRRLCERLLSRSSPNRKDIGLQFRIAILRLITNFISSYPHRKYKDWKPTRKLRTERMCKGYANEIRGFSLHHHTRGG